MFSLLSPFQREKKKYPRCDFLRVREQSEANRDVREARHALIMSAWAGFVGKKALIGEHQVIGLRRNLLRSNQTLMN